MEKRDGGDAIKKRLSCPNCGSHNLKVLDWLNNKFLYKCKDCKHKFEKEIGLKESLEKNVLG